MSFDFDAVHAAIAARLAEDAPLSTRMQTLLDFCEQQTPHADWPKLRAIDYEAELPRLHAWLFDLFSEDPPDFSPAALWFGLYNPCLADGTDVADLYVMGCANFDVQDPDRTWLQRDYWPTGRSANCLALYAVYQFAYADRQTGLGNDAEYPLCLGFTAFALQHLLGELDPELFLQDADLLTVALGFDSGSPFVLGELCRDGLITQWRALD